MLISRKKSIGGEHMEINKYSKANESFLFDLLEDEGDEWIDYHGPAGHDK